MFQNQHTTNNGIALKINDAKISCNAKNTTWNTRLSQFHRTDAYLFICTYSLPNLDYITDIFKKRPYNIHVLFHEKFSPKAETLHDRFPRIKFTGCLDLHAKFVLQEPHTVWLGSANFGRSNWIEALIGIHDKKTFDFFKNSFWEIHSTKGIRFIS